MSIPTRTPGGNRSVPSHCRMTRCTSAERRAKMTGRFLDGVRSSRLAEESARGSANDGTKGPVEPGSVDPDSDEALDAYNAMLARMNQQH